MLPLPAAEPETPDRDILAARRQQIVRAVPGLFAEIAPYVDEPVLSVDARGTLWLVAAHQHDPLVRADARYVIPKGPLADLRRLADSGLRVEHVVVAHEVRPDAKARRLMPLLADGPRRCAPEVARELVGPVPEYPVAARVATAMDAALRGAARGAGAVARSSRRALAQLDPIIFGVVGSDRPLRPGQPALWIALTAWEW
jgi:hypothetical protein